MKTSGSWDPKEAPIFFNASAETVPYILTKQYGPIDLIKHEMVPLELYEQTWSLEWKGDRLVPLNVRDLPHVKNLMIDSGAFGLAKDHSDTTGEFIGDVFSKSVYQIEGGPKLLQRYIEFASQLTPDMFWGLVELDFGSIEDRADLRKKVFDESGVMPIPVYHPSSDPDDYFKQLLHTYDRVCIGGIAKMQGGYRSKVVAELVHLREEAQAECWVHLLGHGLNYKATAFFSSNLKRGFQSFDSSQHVAALAFGTIKIDAQNSPLSYLQDQWLSRDALVRQYDIDGEITTRGQRALQARLELATSLITAQSIAEWNS